ncbi:hypothetical protein PR003_g5864 [Phytophthora rubi]|uniref:Ubiquitin-like protease family profile domain-containing protein n=1 Tax=Phytophthora rubi TaxID=129364 RepID=A0A6A3N977_9STRA|nr:hypothetical protein PR001_g7208 [Phytophthora rubi]KAE9349471.1 hypothetical protein PR003_g5864 [Phytophthora rubi]
MDVAKFMVNALDLEDVEVQGSLSVRPFNVGQRVPKVTKILQLYKIQEAITAIKAKENLNLLANWSDFGYVILDRLEAMARLLEARNRFRLVQFTLHWIDGVEWHLKDVVHPFTDVCDYTKLDKRTKVCYTFDPLQLKADFATVKSSVQNVIKHQVGLQNKITYKEIDWCKQRDNSSCGVWCLVVLELLLSESTWADSHYKVQPYLRMRYLYKATAVQETEVAHDED